MSTSSTVVSEVVFNVIHGGIRGSSTLSIMLLEMFCFIHHAIKFIPTVSTVLSSSVLLEHSQCCVNRGNSTLFTELFEIVLIHSNYHRNLQRYRGSSTSSKVLSEVVLLHPQCHQRYSTSSIVLSEVGSTSQCYQR